MFVDTLITREACHGLVVGRATHGIIPSETIDANSVLALCQRANGRTLGCKTNCFFSPQNKERFHVGARFTFKTTLTRQLDVENHQSESITA